MLQNIREHVQGWIAGVIIVVLALAFVIWGIEFYLEQSAGGGGVVAKVDGKKITESEFNTIFQQLQRNRSAESGVPLSDQLREQLKQYALQQLIVSTALLQAGINAGLNVSMEQVKQLILQVPELQDKGQFSPERFQQLLYNNGISAETFFQNLQASLIINQMVVGIQNSTFFLPNELKQAYELLKEKRTVGYFLIPSQKFVANIHVTQKDITDYYRQNQQNFKTPEKISVSYIILSPKQISASIPISEREIQQYYQANQTNYTIPKRWKIAQIIIPTSTTSPEQLKKAQDEMAQITKELHSGKNFEELMQRRLSGQKIHILWISQDQITEPLSQTLAQLKLQQVSQPLQVAEGLTIIKLLAIEPQKIKSFAEAKTNIVEMLRRQKVEQIFSKKTDQLSNLTYTNPNTLVPAAKQLNLPIYASPLITREGAKTGLLSDPKVLAVVFSNDVLQQNNNSNPIELKNGDLVVVRINQHIPSKQLDLAAVNNQIRDLLIKQMAARKAGLEAYTVQTALVKGVSAEVLAKQYQLHWVMRNEISRTDKTMNQSILTAIFNIRFMPEKPSVTSTLIDKNGNYAVIKLLKITQPDFTKATSTELNTLNTNLENFYGQLAYRLYVKGVMDRTKVKIYPKSLSSN